MKSQLTVEEWKRGVSVLNSAVGAVDTATTQGLLRLAGRERLARDLVLASRNPGVCIAGDFVGESFSERVLFPPDLPEALTGAVGLGRVGTSPQPLSLVLGLSGQVGRLSRSEKGEVTVTLEEPPPEGILAAWSDVLSHHTQCVFRVVGSTSETSQK